MPEGLGGDFENPFRPSREFDAVEKHDHVSDNDYRGLQAIGQMVEGMPPSSVVERNQAEGQNDSPLQIQSEKNLKDDAQPDELNSQGGNAVNEYLKDGWKKGRSAAKSQREQVRMVYRRRRRNVRPTRRTNKMVNRQPGNTQ